MVCGLFGVAQNDQDMLQYARTGNGGTARFTAMGGAFGAVGADLTAGNYNPAGLGVYRKGDVNLGLGLRFTNVSNNLYGNTQARSGSAATFNNFGIAAVWAAKEPDCRNVIAFSNVQSQNFYYRSQMGGYTNSQSIAKDMLNLAGGKSLNSLNSGYEGLAYDTYLLDYDSVGQKYFSFLDINRTVKQTRDIVKSGHVNDLNFSYAYCYKDKFYIGGSLGFPQVKFSSTTTHTEVDDKDSMRISVTSPTTYSSTYTTDLPLIYASRLGFNSLTYEEFYKTTGGGFNFKIGGIYRVSDAFRIGAYYHTSTNYRLTDSYQNTMSVSFDNNKSNPEKLSYPADGGIYTYRIKTPSKVSLNAAVILGKVALIAVDYEAVNYSKASLTSSTPGDFTTVNATIQKVYGTGHNLRVGAEYNISAFKLRVGYYMNGSPTGEVFVGDQVRNIYSAGFGYKSENNFYFDFSYATFLTKENYYLYTTMDTHSKVSQLSTQVTVTAGFKF